MALTVQTTAAATVTNPPTQIANTSASSAGAVVLYEVPAGREFTGFVGTSSYQYFVTINGKGNQVWATNYTTFPIEITLVAGTVVKGSSNMNSFIFGVERDAT
tara:strand:- start:338 stop:646 length:309 start_codon:yes stop_codon:yes gene_type:complete